MAGRQLSKANEARIRTARRHLDAVLKKPAKPEATESVALDGAMSFDDIEAILTDAIQEKYPDTSWVYIRDCYPDQVIYRLSYDNSNVEGELFSCSYEIGDDQEVTLGDATPVVAKTVYDEVKADDVGEAISEATKTVGGETFNSSDFAYVPDPEKPSTWKIRLKEYVDGEKKMTARIVGDAVAALSPGGFRGKKAQIPEADLGKVKSKVRAAWRKMNADKTDDDMPAHMKESAEEFDVVGDYVELREAVVNGDGLIHCKLIAPGHGSSGYYSPEVLRRDIPTVFPVGTQMFLDHATVSESRERPERSMDELVATIATTPEYRNSGAAGAGSYAWVRPRESKKGLLEELGPLGIGPSIYCKGQGRTDTVDGKRTRVIERLIPDKLASIDFVTKPGAGGQVLQLFEAARRGERVSLKESQSSTREGNVTEQEAQALRDDNARLREALLLREARDTATPLLAASGLPAPTQTRLLETVGRNPAATDDGKLDAPKFEAVVKEAISAEANYLKEIGVGGKSPVQGMGGSPGLRIVESNRPSEADLDKRLEATQKRFARGSR